MTVYSLAEINKLALSGEFLSKVHEARANRKKAREKMHLRGTLYHSERVENWYSNAKGEVVLQPVLR